MAISSGWVGSSAVSETSERWMSSAGTKLKVGTPFNMSGLVGKSTAETFTLVVGRASYTYTMYFWGTTVDTVNYGGYSNNSTTTGIVAPLINALVAGSVSAVANTQVAAGSISGTILGCAITYMGQVEGAAGFWIGLTNGPNQGFTISLGGVNYTFTADSFSDNTRHYTSGSLAAGVLYNQNGATLTGSVVT